MELDRKQKLAVQDLGEAINTAIEQSPTVADAIEYLRELGFEPDLNVNLEIGLIELAEPKDCKDSDENLELDLTEEDLRTLQRMKINF